MNDIHKNNAGKLVYWHRDLPPLDAELMAEHTVEATSGRVPGTLSHRDELWDRCYQELMANTQARLAQEIARLGGHYANVLIESIDTRHDDQESAKRIMSGGKRFPLFGRSLALLRTTRAEHAGDVASEAQLEALRKDVQRGKLEQPTVAG